MLLNQEQLVSRKECLVAGRLGSATLAKHFSTAPNPKNFRIGAGELAWSALGYGRCKLKGFGLAGVYPFRFGLSGSICGPVEDSWTLLFYLMLEASWGALQSWKARS